MGIRSFDKLGCFDAVTAALAHVMLYVPGCKHACYLLDVPYGYAVIARDARVHPLHSVDQSVHPFKSLHYKSVPNNQFSLCRAACARLLPDVMSVLSPSGPT